VIVVVVCGSGGRRWSQCSVKQCHSQSNMLSIWHSTSPLTYNFSIRMQVGRTVF